MINHYYTKSQEDWDTKRRRGYAPAAIPSDDYSFSDFYEHELAAATPDERIRRFIPLVEQTLASGPPPTLLPVYLDTLLSVRLPVIAPFHTKPLPARDLTAEREAGALPQAAPVRVLDDMIALLGTPKR